MIPLLSSPCSEVVSCFRKSRLFTKNMAFGRCSMTTRDLFYLIVFVATLSLLFNYEISYYGNVMEDQRVVKGDIYELPITASGIEDLGVKLVLGRSLSQHAADISRNSLQDKVDTSHHMMLKKLQEIESRNTRESRHAGIVFHGFSDGEKIGVMQKLQGTRNSVIQQMDGLSWVTDDTVAQGNWSVLVCKDGCPDDRVHTSEKINRIPSLKSIINRPDITCSITKQIRQNSHTLSDPCQPFRCNASSFDHNLLLLLDNTSYINSSFDQLCNRGTNLLYPVVWRLPEKGMTFPAGQVLMINCGITSFPLLRLYAYPVMYTGPFTALQTIQFFKKISVDDLLQAISDTYGLGTSTRWWREIQTTLMLYFLQAELDIVTETGYQRSRCSSCFQSLQVYMVCHSVQRCQIIQVSSNWTYELDVLDSILSLVSSRRSVAAEVLQALENINYQKNIQICKEKHVGNEQCLTTEYLAYLLEWRREIVQRTEWIPIYPSIFNCRELKNRKLRHSIEGNTVRFNEITSRFGDFNHWSEDINTEIQYTSEGNVDYAQVDVTKLDRSTQGTTRLCSKDSEDFGKIREIVTNPEINLTRTSSNSYNASVDYDVILIRLWVTSASCRCQVKLENKYNDPGPRNITLALGENKIMVYVFQEDNSVYNIIKTFTLTITRRNRGLTDKYPDNTWLAACGLKQECSSRFDYSAPCGLIDLRSSWNVLPPKVKCSSGDHEGQWIVPCQNCLNESSCYWTKAKWRPYECQYTHLPPSSLKNCLQGKKILFIGDSTNRGVSNYITEQINGSLYDWDKTHSTKVYTNVNGNQTQISFAYYPHFWLPPLHRPKFSKVIYQLIKSSLPLQNNSNTILVVGGVHWLAQQHIDLIIEALQSKGLSGITKAVKGLGAGFHQKVEDVRFVPDSEQPALQQRETEVLNYAKSKEFYPIATFNMTISRYKDFLEGKCACHFHKLTKQEPRNGHTYYSVEGSTNEAYSQILLNQICQQWSSSH